MNIAFGAPLPEGELAARCKVFDCGVSLCGFIMGCKQAGKAEPQQGGE
jgi:hypothetical protein